ncbi:hypothetical protein HF086_012798 [Spodoptera exigua]|uniref:Uncharacterized protein n=1 Tax=Spodoptera exigua TaxID=7107 RepID=A0A922MK94_SPOEX|nr:hypothetical protein HF086_012798 [Spodoptera exigua]
MSNIRNTENFMNEPHLRHDNELPKENQSIVKVLGSVHNNLYSDDIDFDVDSFDNDEYYDYNIEEQYIENGNENDSSEESSLWFVNTNSPEYYYRDGDSIDYNNNNEDEPNNVVSETDSGACSDYDI